MHRELRKGHDFYTLGNQRSFHLVERFIPGDVFQVDSSVYGGEVLFAVGGQYGQPPMETFHCGGIFTSHLLDRQSSEAGPWSPKSERVLGELGLLRSVSHTEFIRGQDGRLYFLETSARVGGAHVAACVACAPGTSDTQVTPPLRSSGAWTKTPRRPDR